MTGATTAAAPAHRGLLKVLGVAFGMAVIVGNTIGSGILRTPGDVAAALPSSAWFIALWVAGGLYALCGAMTLAELAVLMPQSGGEYVYARRTFGEYAGFVIGWTDWASTCAATASVAIALGELLGQQFPALAAAQTAIAVGATLAFLGLHWRGVKSSDRAQQALSLAKTLAFVAVAIVCFLPARSAPPVAAAGAGTPALAAMPAGFALAGAIIVSLQSVIYTYDGWNGALYFGGELHDPAREIPRAMGGGVVVVLLVYLALNAASLHALGMAGLAGSKFPSADAAGVVLGAAAQSMVRAVMAVSLVGALSALVLISSRVPYAMAVDGLLPARLTRVTTGGTPTFSLVASVVATVLFIATNTFETVIAIAALFFVLKYCVSFSAVFALRRREPDLPRPYRAWGYPWITGLLLVGSVGFVAGNFVTDRQNSVRALYVLAASGPVYLLARRFRLRSR
ncbi:MAG TPA: APC family permease [Gemmatimonadaceae bacterium]|nr:APC family permease [Gemmatimonadaceae bacterium]